MKVVALFYYDKPLLRAFLSHYCRLNAVDGIHIQDQNWSEEDSAYLRETAAEYSMRYGKPVEVHESPFQRVDGRWEGKGKRGQFWHYGEAVIRNTLNQHVGDEVFIAGAMDEVVYGDGYWDTDWKLCLFEELAKARARAGKMTVGFLQLWNAYADGFHPNARGLSHRRAPPGVEPDWRHRLFRFPMPFRRDPDGGRTHDTTYQAFMGEGWVNVTPGWGLETRGETRDCEHYFPVELRLLHYHTLVRPGFESTDFRVPDRSQFKDIDQHPKHYLEELFNQR